jgi:hypothetical protein
MEIDEARRDDPVLRRNHVQGACLRNVTGKLDNLAASYGNIQGAMYFLRGINYRAAFDEYVDVRSGILVGPKRCFVARPEFLWGKRRDSSHGCKTLCKLTTRWHWMSLFQLLMFALRNECFPLCAIPQETPVLFRDKKLNRSDVFACQSIPS